MNNEPPTENEKRYLREIADKEDEARPPFDRSAQLPNPDGDDAWLYEKQDV